MTFETFLNLLVKIAANLYPDQDVRGSIDATIEKYFLPIHETIMQETIAGDIYNLVSKEVVSEELQPFVGVVSV